VHAQHGQTPGSILSTKKGEDKKKKGLALEFTFGQACGTVNIGHHLYSEYNLLKTSFLNVNIEIWKDWLLSWEKLIA
jgi:hypothetical protein